MSRNNKKRNQQTQKSSGVTQPEPVQRSQAITLPKLTDANVAFNSYPREWFTATLELPISRTDLKPHEAVFHNLFFRGGTIPVHSTCPASYSREAIRALRAVSGSFEPRHEDKVRVCAIILRSLQP